MPAPRPLLLLLSLLPLCLASRPANEDPCLFQGINVASFGNATRQTSLEVTWNRDLCHLETRVDAPVCCGTVLIGHSIVVADSLLTPPFPLAEPFFPGSLLYVGLEILLGPLTGSDAVHIFPADPALAGRAFFAQGIAIIFDPTSAGVELGVSQGTIAQLML